MFASIILLYLIVPISLIVWLISLVYYTSESEYDHQQKYYHPITPFKVLWSFAVPVILGLRGIKKGNLSPSGCIAAMIVGFILTLINYCFLSAMLAFYLLASKATKYKMLVKRQFEKNPEQAAARNWVQVLCNGGIATQMALFYFLEAGCRETVIDFDQNYSASVWMVNVVAALACSSGDTFASELGPVLPLSQPYLITSFQKVPKGTNGGISVAGCLASALGGLVVGIGFYVALVLAIPSVELAASPSQWPILIFATLAGVIGSTIDSLLGATLQYSGIDKEDGCIVETPGTDIVYVSGTAILDNHSVNLLSSLLTCVVTSQFSLYFWGMFVRP